MSGLRLWQAAFLDDHGRATGVDYLLVATPGSGKTLAACEAARAAGCKQVIVVAPTTALRSQWADVADLVGLHLDPRWRNADGTWNPDAHGVVVTYQQVASAPDLFAHHLARPTFVILDEIHHAGESATWGTALRTAFDRATFRLALSGTPFRSDARAIPFVPYDSEHRCAPDFVYGYGEAIRDEVCRRLAFRLLDATLRWRVDEHEQIAAFGDELDPVDDARRLLRQLDQSERALGTVLEFVRRERVGSGARDRASSGDVAGPSGQLLAPGPDPHRRHPMAAHRRIEEKRRALDRLARRWAQLRRAIDPDYTWQYAQARVNRAMGVNKRTEAGERDLDDGLRFLRSELTKLARDYPEEAERLRILGSLEAIENRLLEAQ